MSENEQENMQENYCCNGDTQQPEPLLKCITIF